MRFIRDWLHTIRYRLRHPDPARHQQMIQDAAEPFRGMGVILAVACDDYPMVLAFGNDMKEVYQRAHKTGRVFFLQNAPPPDDAPVTIFSLAEATT